MLVKESARYGKWLKFEAGQLDPDKAKFWSDRLRAGGYVPATPQQELELLQRVNNGLQKKFGFDVVDFSDMAPGGRKSGEVVAEEGYGTWGDIYRDIPSPSRRCPFSVRSMSPSSVVRPTVVNNEKWSGFPEKDPEPMRAAAQAHEAFEQVATSRAADRRKALMDRLGLDETSPADMDRVNMVLGNIYEKKVKGARKALERVYSGSDRYSQVRNGVTDRFMDMMARAFTNGDHESFYTLSIFLSSYLDNPRIASGFTGYRKKVQNYGMWDCLSEAVKKSQVRDVRNNSFLFTENPGRRMHIRRGSNPGSKNPVLSIQGNHADASVMRNERDLVYSKFPPDSESRKWFNALRDGDEAEAFNYQIDRKEHWKD